MSDSNIMGSWALTVKRYCDEWRSYEAQVREGQIPGGATEEEIETLVQNAELRGLHLDEEILAFLRFVNGTSFDGLNLYGAEIPSDDAHGRIDFIESNDAYNDQPSRYTHYGTSATDLYRYDSLSCDFQVVDNGGGGIVDTCPSFGLLVDRAITTNVIINDAR